MEGLQVGVEQIGIRRHRASPACSKHNLDTGHPALQQVR